MKNYQNDNLLAEWFVWHFYEMPKFIFGAWKNFIFFVSDFFSVSLLIRTLFYPWRRYRWNYPKSFSVRGYYETFISNVFSRLFGAVARFFLIIAGIMAIFFTLLAGAVALLIWILLPFILVLSVIALIYV